MSNYKMSEAEEMFRRLGYHRWESKNLECIKYEKKGVMEIAFLLYNQSYYAQIVAGDINFEKYRPMEITVELQECINKQIEELGWKGKSRE